MTAQPQDKMRAEFEATMRAEPHCWMNRAFRKSKTEGQTYADFCVEVAWKTWQAACAQQSAQSQQDAVHLEHVAVAEDGGQLRWMSGRKPRDCELYAMPDGSAIRVPLYRMSAISAQGASNV